MASEFKLPELGENIDSGVVTKLLVSVGDKIVKDQPVLELETDKAVIEVPSGVSGVVTQLFVKEGEKATVGQLILTVEPTSARPTAVAEVVKQAPEPVPVETEQSVGKRARPSTVVTEERIPTAPPRPLPPEPTRAPAEANVVSLVPRVEASAEARPEPAPAAPSVRRLARELGVDINQVTGSGPAGQITVEDVKQYVRQLMTGGGLLRPVGAPTLSAVPEHSRWGEIERVPMSSVRRKTAEHMASAWANIPHVTQHDQADITQLEQLRQQFAARAQAAGGKLTVTAILMKVVASALKLFPQFNASLDMSHQTIVYKKYIHIGVAVDTDRGLLVPVIRDVDRKNVIELSVELAAAAERARTKKTTLEEMQGGTFTITNLGGIGGTAFTPIVNEPEVAILGVARARMQPVYINGQFEPRLMLPLSLSYDHRLIDGADAARFLRWIAEALEQPFVLMLEG
ncbi:MAG: 2-oxo acid dehydrogenase subunit E2 [Blastocatellia bacterium]|nr:2-oxo acid dehydrogenase subunit E2 [Blastocatellia bacterium]